MNLKQLEAFVRVAETKNFSEAARQLYLTQPTVSAHISALEKELDICLFIRSTKEVKLSDAGRELYTYAEKMLAIEREIREHFGTSARKGKRILKIAASTIPSQYLLPDIMVRFCRKYPAEQLNVAETDSAGVVERIVSHQADIGFAGSESSIYVYAEGQEDYAVNFAQLTQRAGNFLVSRTEDPDFKWDDLKGQTVLGGRAGGRHSPCPFS